jgi:hypothetical protein
VSNPKKEIFSVLRDLIFLTKEIKLAEFNNNRLIEEMKSLKVIELDNLKDLHSYINYDHYLIIKNNNNYYFCDVDLYPGIGEQCLLKVIDYNQILRKDKIKRIDENTTY